MKKIIKLICLSWLWLSFVIIFIDIAIKQTIMKNMYLHETYQLTSFLNIFYCHNYGIAFSFLDDGKIWQRWFFTIVSIIVIIFLLVISYYDYLNNKICIAYILIISGALGNLIDRFYYGFVIDFIDFHIKNSHFPTFNIADCSIVIGVILLMLKYK
ncbi:signal peptidase II [Candidatus Pantoea edessiphila]|uniref:Lipoprotein signal peptidase n=1 Tax=Candidatus Pantoea edessiphila TaxID=2044610 RepID=A0A2P5T261_9GAMM|nr:signal peptidase II [Candidatus Pantoea edessiphila]PPI88632.1 signal peptidase II [Candidatus Pantoea edessiphila]